MIMQSFDSYINHLSGKCEQLTFSTVFIGVHQEHAAVVKF